MINENVVRVVRPSCLYHFKMLALGIVLLPVIVGLFILIALVIKILSTKYTITDQRVLVEKGWFATSQMEVRIGDIRAVNMNRSFWQWLGRNGTVQIATAATDGAEITMRGVPRPAELVELLNSLRK